MVEKLKSVCVCVEHSVECKALLGEPSTREVEHFLHQTQPSEACAKVGLLTFHSSVMRSVKFNNLHGSRYTA